MGYPLSELPEKRSLTYPGDANYNLGYESGYIRGYEGEGICESITREILNIFASGGSESEGVNLATGSLIGKVNGEKDFKNGKMNIFSPKIKKNKPLIKEKR